MYKTGLVIGKFYPPHKGHSYLINTALSQAEHVVVLVCDKQGQLIPGKLRANWIKTSHPKAEVRVIEDNLADDDSKGWAEYTISVLGYIPEVVFTSEDYGEPYSNFLGNKHILVDRERKHVPISATKIRSNPLENLDFLNPQVRSYFIKRICIVGAESTGTTTLSQDLARYYKTCWVPEFGRLYWEGKMFNHDLAWRTEEFEFIGSEQNQIEDKLAESANKVLICDTNSWATNLWHERYLGSLSDKVGQLSSNRAYDLYILTDVHIPFVQDGTRDGESIRSKMHQRFIEELDKSGFNYIIVSGSPSQRLHNAVKEIDLILKEARFGERADPD